MSISHQTNLKHEGENDSIELIPSSNLSSNLKKFKTIIKNDLIENDIDLPMPILSEGSCRSSQVSANEYLRIKKNLVTKEKSLDYADESFEDKSISNDSPLAKIETPWIPLPKSLDIQVTDCAKHSQSAKSLLINETKSKKAFDLDFNLMQKAKKLGVRSSLQYSNSKNNSLGSVLSLAKNTVFTSIKDSTPACKTQEFLEKENKMLRDKLKQLNHELNELIENSKSKAEFNSKSKGKKKLDQTNLSHSDANIDKRLKIYDSEFKKIQFRYEKITDSEYLKQIAEEVNKKTKILNKLEKKVKELEKSQMNRIKLIEGLDSSLIPEEKQSHSQLVEELFKYTNQITNLELLIAKKTNLHKLNQKKESKLIEKIEILKPYTQPLKPVNKDLEAKYEKLKQTLLNLEKTKSSSIKQLKALEHSTKSEKEETFKHLQQIEENFNKKSENLKIIQTELKHFTSLASKLNLSLHFIHSNPRSRSEVKLNNRSIHLEPLDDSIKNKFNKSDIYISPDSNKNSGKAKSEAKLKVKGQIMVEKFIKSVKDLVKKKRLDKGKDENENDDKEEVEIGEKILIKKGKEENGEGTAEGFMKYSMNPLFKENKSAGLIDKLEEN